MRATDHTSGPAIETFDVAVIGAGLGGIYALHRFRQMGLSVIGLEAAPAPGGVWYHNRYPGARVDLESHDYCYFFSRELFEDWQWSERYAAQPEILAYLNHVVDRFDIRRLISFNTRLEAATHQGDAWLLRTSTDRKIRCQYLIMATGNLSAPRRPKFPGLDDFAGEVLETSSWPERPISFTDRTVGVIGTGSSGVQCIPEIARQAKHLYVFQRTPNYSIPANNTAANASALEHIRANVPAAWQELLTNVIGKHVPPGTVASPPPAAAAVAPETRIAELERAWDAGGHAIALVFRDQGTNKAANDVVSNFVRDKIRQMVHDPLLAEKLLPPYPIGTRRLCVDTRYFETYNRPNVTLVDLNDEPIETFHDSGLRTSARGYHLDAAVLALGFEAFSGQLNAIDIRNEAGRHLTETWSSGPRAYLGLMVPDFPNLFLLTGPGSPSVLSNLFALNEYHVNWIADLITHLDQRGHRRVSTHDAAQSTWTAHVQELAQPLLRYNFSNYMVHVNHDDGSRLFVPYCGGLNRYVTHCDRLAREGYEGFIFE